MGNQFSRATNVAQTAKAIGFYCNSFVSLSERVSERYTQTVIQAGMKIVEDENAIKFV